MYKIRVDRQNNKHPFLKSQNLFNTFSIALNDFVISKQCHFVRKWALPNRMVRWKTDGDTIFILLWIIT